MNPETSPAMSTDPAPAVELLSLRHRYAKAERDALGGQGGVDLAVAPGEAFALLGPNGGGKSTAFRIIGTLLRPTAGTARVTGFDVHTHPAAARAALGVVFQNPSVDVHLTATENLVCQARLYGIDRATATARAAELLERLGLADRAGERVGAFSGGMRRRVEIAKALLHEPAVLLMDEPTTGLDPAARRQLWTSLAQLRADRGLTVVWTTHLLDEAEHADRVGVLAQGQLLTVATPAQVQDACGGNILAVEPADAADLPHVQTTLHDALGPWAQGAAPRCDDTTVRFEHAGGAAVVARAAELLEGTALRRVSVGRPTLEDAYLKISAASSAEGPATDPASGPATEPATVSV